MFATPLRAAALGVLLVAAITLAISLSDRLIALVKSGLGPEESRAARERFRGHTLRLVALAIALIVVSEVLQ